MDRIKEINQIKALFNKTGWTNKKLSKVSGISETKISYLLSKYKGTDETIISLNKTLSEVFK